MGKSFNFLISILLVLAAALIQSTDLINFYGVKPNLVLVMVAVFLFFTDNFWEYLVISLGGIAALKFVSAFEKESLVLFILLAAAYIFKKYLLHKSFIHILLLITFLTTLFYLLINFNFIILNPLIFILELVYNNFIGLAIYLSANFIYEKTKPQ
ncbi:MAG: hypothetical protein Athens071426_546 [Parcubacteria group bacterium Athens0714_26]|nr:MAG: hypothetical protein Athens101426_696 [Parcubacteria group bacterium Athens1014_26]TSD02208.1 MAG: hypothetical protein Athens071426_546 [Parcubacteria group bacterium Athens0714_26]